MLLNMNFWENVDAELKFKGITRKALAAEVGFDQSNIGKGIKDGNVPSVDTGVKIAKALGVSVEYLVEGPKSKTVAESGNNQEERKFYQYAEIIYDLDAIPEQTRKPILLMIKELGETYTKSPQD